MKKFVRKALIISSWLRTDSSDFKRGVSEDIAQIKSFLKSGYGGSFREKKEIAHLHRPSVESLEGAMSWLKNADYAFVYYSGHGMSIRQRAYIALDEISDFPVRPLANISLRQITIVDTCRNEIEPVSLFEGIGNPYGDVDLLPSEFARNAFAALMQRQPSGRVLIQSGSYNQSSYSTANGGVFTNSLVAGLQLFYGNSSHSLLKTTSAFELAKNEMRRSQSWNQRPQITQTLNLDQKGLLLAIHPELIYDRPYGGFRSWRGLL
jgi:hypothetical protein